MQPIRRIIVKELLILLGILAAVSAGLGLVGTVGILDQQIALRSGQDLSKLAREIRRDLQDVERAGRVAARWWQAGDGNDVASTESHMAALMEEVPSIANVVFIDMDGRGLSMSRMADGVSSYRLDARPTPALKQYLRKGSHPLAGTPWEPTTYRVYERPWFQAASHGAGPQWVGAYPFANRPVHGLTYAMPLKDTQGRFLGALCIDIFLDALSERTWAVQPTPHSLALVSDEGGRAIILPKGVDAHPASVEGSAFLTPVSPSFLPLFDGVLRRWQALGRTDQGFRIRSQGASYTCIVHSLEGVEGVRWNLSLAVPDAEYRAAGRRVAYGILVAGAVAALLAMRRAVRMARAFSAPLEALARAADALGTGAPVAPPPSAVAEIQTLGDAITRAGQTLEREAELRARLQQSQRIETLGTLTGGIAHDVNNQLAAVVGQLYLGREDLEAGHPARVHLDRAEEAAHRCTRMLGSLLSFTHKARPDLTPLDLNEVVRLTASLAERLLGGRIALGLDLDPRLPPILGESVSLEQVLMNLAVNARDAMPEGGSLTFRTRVRAGEEVILTVRDTGAGMPREVLARCFDPFYTTKPIGKGTGLGLAMVASIVKVHGGRVEVDSEPGRGTEFRLHLPVAQAAPPEASPGPAAPRAPISLEGLRILVVEDEEPVRAMLAEALASRRAQVDVAPNGPRGWERFQAGTYDLVISDQRMPELSGLELLALIRASDATLPVILVSGFGLEEAGSLLDEDPNLRIIQKPFDLLELFRLVGSLAAAGRT